MFSKKNLEERRFWKSFLAVYKQYPEIWDPRCDKYSKREYKEVAYQALAHKLKEIDPYASTDCVKRRLNIFKSNYKRELRRRTKTGTKGNLWYFDDLDFLIDIDKTRIKKPEMKSDSSDFYFPEIHNQATGAVKNEGGDVVDNNCLSNYNQNLSHHSFHHQVGSTFGSSDENINLNEAPHTETPQSSSFNNNPNVFPGVQTRPVGSEQSQPEDSLNDDSNVDDDYQQPVEKVVKVNEDDADVYSRGWATTFRKIPAAQQQLAKKLIDDILYEGYMGRLAEGKVQIVN